MNTYTDFEKAEWIWHSTDCGEDEYTEFTDSFTRSGEKTTINISARGDYTLFVNGKYAASGQYADFEHYKVYDEIDITDFLSEGVNKIAVIGWYFNKSSMRWLLPRQGVIYEVVSEGKVICASCEGTQARKSRAYLSGRGKKITFQLGYSFLYNAAKEDEWKTSRGEGFKSACVIPGSKILYKRPIKKHILAPVRKGVIEKTKNGYLINFKEETVGLCTFSFTCAAEQKITVSYGEILENGHVKRIIEDRDFSFDYITKKGKNVYTNYMLRFGCRYMEIECDGELDFDYFGIIPTEYEVKINPERPKDELDRRIYDICLNSLLLCMMEH